MGQPFAPGVWGIPVVQSTIDRGILFPTPLVHQRVWNLETHATERWDGTQWLTDDQPIALSVRSFGAKGDGVADDSVAINTTIAAVVAAGGGDVFFPPGTYAHASNLIVSLSGTTPISIALTGTPYASVLKPTSAVTVCLTVAGDTNTDGMNNRVSVRGLYLDGVNTTGRTGLLVGENAGNVSSYIQLDSVQVMRFAGTGGIGLYVKNVVGLSATNVYCGRSYKNCYIGGSDTALPTVVTFGQGCAFREGTTKGLQIDHGYRVTFRSCVFEANGEEGLYMVPGVSQNALMVDVDGCWFESNWNGSGSQATSYSLKADGSAAGSTAELRVANTFFNGACRAIYMKNVVNASLDNVRPQNAAHQVVIDTGCQGEVTHWPENNAPYATVVDNGSTSTMIARGDTWIIKNLIVQGTLTADADVTAASTLHITDAIVGNAAAQEGPFLQPGPGGTHGALRDPTAQEVLRWYADRVELQQGIKFNGATKGLTFVSGANGRTGSATLSSGAVTVSNTSVTTNSVIFLAPMGSATNAGELTSTVTAGTSFVITSSNAADARTIKYMIVELA